MMDFIFFKTDAGNTGIRFFLILLVAITGLSVNTLAESRKALKMLEKEEYDKLAEHLDKAIEKEPVNPGARYVYSLMYLASGNAGYNIDTAYQYILGAITDFALIDEKELDRLSKLEIDSAALAVQKAAVEEDAFARAKTRHTVADYNFFIDVFSSSSRLDSVIYFRNDLAFEQAKKENTYESYYDYMRTYPDALQVAEAQKRYDALLYSSHTDDGRLESYERFIRNNPGSPFRAEAEKHIFEISTADNAIESYVNFLEQYPDSPVKKRCLAYLYHRYKYEGSAQRFLNRFGPQLKDDSLKRTAMADEGYVIPIFEMGQYGFIRDNGLKLIDFKYSDIHEDYLCGHVTSDFLDVWDEQRHLLVSRLGSEIMKGNFQSVEDLGCGLLKVERAGFYGLIHKSGGPLLDAIYQDLGLVAGALVKYQLNGKWGLMSISGRNLLAAEYDDIFSEGHFILIKKGDLYDVHNTASLSKAANLDKVSVTFRFDDFVLMDDNHLIVFNGNEEAVVDQTLSEKIPVAEQEVQELYNGWMVKKNNKYRIYDQAFYLVSPLEFDNVKQKGKKIALKYQGRWALYNIEKEFPLDFPYDSIQLLSEQIALLTRGQKLYASFENDTVLDISGSMDTRLLSDLSLPVDEGPPTTYLVTQSARGGYKVFSTAGNEIMEGKYTSVEALGKEYLLVERNRKKGLIHASGKVALKAQYSAIGNYDKGYVSTLLNGKFGIYNYTKDQLLSAKYEKRLHPYGDRYFIGVQKQKSAFINLENKNISGFRFDKVEYWNDTSALVMEDGIWYIYDILHEKVLYKDIDTYKLLNRTENEILMLITRQGKVGVISNLLGEIIAPTFNDVINVGSADRPVYFAEKYIPEAEFYVIIYYDGKGKILRKQVFNKEEYDNIYCG